MAEGQQQVPVDTKYLPELMAEKDSIDPSFVHAVRLISSEIGRIKNPQSEEKGSGLSDDGGLVDANDGKPIKRSLSIKVPTDRYPNFNFVGRLLGPGGSTLKGIQTTTSTQIAILGKGSMRDKKKADDLAAGGDPKYQHLKLPLHVRISSVSSLDQATINIGHAATEIVKLMQPTPDDDSMDHSMSSRGMGQRGGMMRGRGGRGASSGRGGGGRGGRGSRGGASQRGSTQSRGRGSTGRGGGAYAAKAQDPYAAPTGYDYGLESYEGYGTEYAAADPTTYDAYGAEAYTDAYSADASYGEAAYATDAYGYGDASYGSYGNGADASLAQYGSTGTTASKPFRGKMRGGSGRGRGASKPY